MKKKKLIIIMALLSLVIPLNIFHNSISQVLSINISVMFLLLVGILIYTNKNFASSNELAKSNNKITFFIFANLTKLINKLGIANLKIIQKIGNSLYILPGEPYAFVDNFKIYLDKKDSLRITLKGKYEPYELYVMQKEINAGDNVLDIGANIGHHTLFISKYTGVKGSVFAFEPDPTNFELLKKNLASNKISNVTAVNKAVSNESGTIKLYVSKNNKADHRIFESVNKRPSIQIECVTLDDYFTKLNSKIDFIKMDVQGAEYKVLAGAENLIKKSNSLKIMTEYWPKGLSQCGPNHHILLIDMLLKYNFKLYDLNENKKSIKQITKQKLLLNYSIENNLYTNILAIKT